MICVMNPEAYTSTRSSIQEPAGRVYKNTAKNQRQTSNTYIQHADQTKRNTHQATENVLRTLRVSGSLQVYKLYHTQSIIPFLPWQTFRSFMSHNTTVAPQSAKRSAIALPSPWAAPVTRTMSALKSGLGRGFRLTILAKNFNTGKTQ